MKWFKSLFHRKKSPVELYKEKQAAQFIEDLKRIEYDTDVCGNIRFIGLSEYGAQCHVEEGTTPNKHEKVLLADGSLITFEEWKENNK